MAELEKKIQEYREYKRKIYELELLAAAAADEIKAEMVKAGQDQMTVGQYRLSYTDYTRTTLDTKRLEADLGDLSDYKKTITYKQFRVA